MCLNPEWPEHGGLMAYGVDSVVAFRRAAEYVDQILRGAKPENLPIEQPTQSRLVIKRLTAEQSDELPLRPLSRDLRLASLRWPRPRVKPIASRFQEKTHAAQQFP